MNLRLTTFAILAAAAHAAGCRGSKATGPASSPPAQAFQVATAAVVERPVPRVIPLTGTLTANVRTDLTANATGRVARTFVERGQMVNRGAALAQLDVRSAAASAAEAEAESASANTQLEAARADCARYDALAARGAITKQEHDKQTAACQQQVAALDASRARAVAASLGLSDGTIRAPFAGVVTERFVSVGDYVQPSSKVVTLVASDPLRLQLTVPERRVPEVEAGAVVTFSPASMPDRTFSGGLRYLSGEIRASTRDMVVEAVVPNAGGALLPGMFVQVSLQVGARPMPVVPRTAIFATGQDASLYVVRDRRLVLRTVMLGAQDDDAVAIEEGAKPGEIVVTNPSPAMFDGAAVQ